MTTTGSPATAVADYLGDRPLLALTVTVLAALMAWGVVRYLFDVLLGALHHWRGGGRPMCPQQRRELELCLLLARDGCLGYHRATGDIDTGADPLPDPYAAELLDLHHLGWIAPAHDRGTLVAIQLTDAGRTGLWMCCDRGNDPDGRALYCYVEQCRLDADDAVAARQEALNERDAVDPIPVCCAFERDGEGCPNEAIVIVTLPAVGQLPAEDYPTCATCLPDWRDDVQATARLIETATV